MIEARRKLGGVGRKLALLLLMATSQGCGRDTPEALWEQATTAWAAQALDEASEKLDRLARLRPLKNQERLLQAQIASQRNDPERAIAILGEVASDGPDSERAAMRAARGRLLLQVNRYRLAEADLRAGLTFDQAPDDCYRSLIHLLAAQGRVNEVEATFRDWAGARRGKLNFEDLYLWTLGRREDLGPAELARELRRAMEEDPQDQASSLAFAEASRRAGRLNEAEEVIDRFQAVPIAKVLKARVALDRGEREDARAMLDAIEEGKRLADPMTRLAWWKLHGRLALMAGQSSEAVADLSAARAAGAEDRETLFVLAQSLRMQGNETSARPVLEFVKARDRLEWLVQNARPPDRRTNPKVLEEIGDACAAVDRWAVAHAWYRLALDFDPSSTAILKKLRAIELDKTRESVWKADSAFQP